MGKTRPLLQTSCSNQSFNRCFLFQLMDQLRDGLKCFPWHQCLLCLHFLQCLPCLLWIISNTWIQYQMNWKPATTQWSKNSFVSYVMPFMRQTTNWNFKRILRLIQDRLSLSFVRFVINNLSFVRSGETILCLIWSSKLGMLSFKVQLQKVNLKTF